MSRDRPLSDRQGGDADGGLIQAVRSAIAAGDRTAALHLLRAFVEGTSDLSTTLTPAVGDALVATARGALPDDRARAVLEELDRAQQARGQIIELLTHTPFSVADLAAIRRVLKSMDSSATRRRSKQRVRTCCTARRSRNGGWAPCGWSSSTSPIGAQTGSTGRTCTVDGEKMDASVRDISERYRAMRSILMRHAVNRERAGACYHR